VPAELWRRLIADTKRDRPDAVFVAETLGCSPWDTIATAGAGFDFVFNSAKWWDFRSHWLLEQRKLIGELVPSIGFPESHDTPRLADEMNGNPNASKLWYLFTASFSAGCLMPVGFEFGFRRSLHVVSTRREDWETTSVDLCQFITAVNRLKADQPIFSRESSMLLLPSSNPAVLIMWQGSATLGQEASCSSTPTSGASSTSRSATCGHSCSPASRWWTCRPSSGWTMCQSLLSHTSCDLGRAWCW
jgi:starch synthase (maltosyl-transferring)